MKFYLNENGKWVIGNYSGVPSGTCSEHTDPITGKILIRGNGIVYAWDTLPTEFQDKDGVNYTNLQAYENATKDFFVDATLLLSARVAELEERQTLFIDYIGLIEPVKVDEYIWYEDENKQLFICINDQWLTLPLSENSIYIYRVTNEQFAWNGADLIPMTVPLTKPAIESLIYSPRVLLNNTTIDLAIGEIFDRFETPLTGATTFTITNTKKYKGFRLKLKGGTLNTDLFSGYTENWIISNLITDYNPTTGMWLNCEIREDNNIYLFWGE